MTAADARTDIPTASCRRKLRYTHHHCRGAQEHRHLRDANGDGDRFLELDAATCNEGCNSPELCYYEVSRRASAAGSLQLVHHYDINLSYGHFILTLGPNGEVVVTDSKNTDQPS